MILEEIKKDIKQYEQKADSMRTAIGWALSLTIIFVLYILVPDVVISICNMAASWFDSLVDKEDSENAINYLYVAGSDIFRAIISSRKAVGDLKGILTAIPVVFSALFVGSYANYRLLQQHIHELNLKKYEVMPLANNKLSDEAGL